MSEAPFLEQRIRELITSWIADEHIIAHVWRPNEIVRHIVVVDFYGHTYCFTATWYVEREDYILELNRKISFDPLSAEQD